MIIDCNSLSELETEAIKLAKESTNHDERTIYFDLVVCLERLKAVLNKKEPPFNIDLREL